MFRLQGALFFGAAERICDGVLRRCVADRPQVVVLRMSGLSMVDASGGRALRSARRAATTSPISIACTRSSTTVSSAVTPKDSAADGPERSTARTVGSDTIRTLVTSSTPANAAEGMRDTGPVAR
ncbi:sodium-independent anion transporter [Pseudonocardia oroxyli]|uniref:sodium-independent anion transporter n=1 Tax=Pseudonocardia oroxyli TaxID=366584 RepID=UPI003CCBA1EA